MGKRREVEGTPRETWEDWVPDAPRFGEVLILSRAEVLAQLERLGLGVTERKWRDWEYEGCLPCTVMRSRDPGQDPARAWSPWWIVDLIAKVCAYQRARFDLGELPRRMRVEARALAHAERDNARWGGPPADASLIASRFATAPPGPVQDFGDYIRLMAPPTGPRVPPSALADEIAGGLAALAGRQARDFREGYGIEIAQVTLILTDRHGRSYPFEVPLPESAEGAPGGGAVPGSG